VVLTLSEGTARVGDEGKGLCLTSSSVENTPNGMFCRGKSVSGVHSMKEAIARKGLWGRVCKFQIETHGQFDE
jgi:hypothetical protein